VIDGLGEEQPERGDRPSQLLHQPADRRGGPFATGTALHNGRRAGKGRHRTAGVMEGVGRLARPIEEARSVPASSRSGGG